jgi:hypothetical protein
LQMSLGFKVELDSRYARSLISTPLLAEIFC